MSERVTRQDSGGVCTLTLNRPEKLNALDTASFTALDAHLRDLEKADDKVGCVVLRGAGKAFCAGADLGAMSDPKAEKAPPSFKPGVVWRVGLLKQPVIAAVHGVCYTGGLELALACDFIVADTTSRFADTHGKWGLVGAWGISQRLPRRIGPQAAKRMMMTSRIVEAAEARDLGLIDILAEEGRLDEALKELVDPLIANSWFTNFAVKRLMKETDGLSLSQALTYEQANYPGLAPDHIQRVAAFGRKQGS